MIYLELPAPPSVNAMFRNVRGKGRVRTGHYDSWRDHAGWELRSQKPGRLFGPVMVVISVERQSRRSDIDNRVKAILDLIVHHNVIEDDKFVIGIAVAWAPIRDRDHPVARIAIYKAGDMSFDFLMGPDGASGGWFKIEAETKD